MKQYVFTILFTATVTFALSWAVWRLSMKYKLYPGIRERDVHKTPTPRLGGIAMFLGVDGRLPGLVAEPVLRDHLGPARTSMGDPGRDVPDRGRRCRR